MTRKRVFVIEHSSRVQGSIIEMIKRDPRLEFVGTASDVEGAIANLPRTRPDVIALGTWFPKTDLVKMTKRLMTDYPLPIVLVSSHESAKANAFSTVEALKAGALAVTEYIPGAHHETAKSSGEQLCTQLTIMSEVKVVRYRPQLLTEFQPRLQNSIPNGRTSTLSGVTKDQKFELIGIVASTGGPRAILNVVNDLPPDVNIPILVVQHMAPGFLNGFVKWLDTNCSFPVTFAQSGQKPKGGIVYVAPPEVHLTFEHGVLQCDSKEPVDGHCPSGTVLFRSMACSVGQKGLGVLLTGMGKDGAEGLFHLRKAGGYTIAEHKSTAVVYGMPDAACRLHGVCASIPLPHIGSTIKGLLQGTHIRAAHG